MCVFYFSKNKYNFFFCFFYIYLTFYLKAKVKIWNLYLIGVNFWYGSITLLQSLWLWQKFKLRKVLFIRMWCNICCWSFLKLSEVVNLKHLAYMLWWYHFKNKPTFFPNKKEVNHSIIFVYIFLVTLFRENIIHFLLKLLYKNIISIYAWIILLLT